MNCLFKFLRCIAINTKKTNVCRNDDTHLFLTSAVKMIFFLCRREILTIFVFFAKSQKWLEMMIKEDKNLNFKLGTKCWEVKHADICTNIVKKSMEKKIILKTMKGFIFFFFYLYRAKFLDLTLTQDA